MKMRHRIVLAAALLSLASHRSPAVARASQTSNDSPWNSEHISGLPEEIKKAIADLRVNANLLNGINAILPVQTCLQKYIASRFTQISNISIPSCSL
jgi:hypothetical protein